MNELIPLNKVNHAKYKAKPVSSFDFCKTQNLCPITIQELHKILAQSPIIFAKDANSNFNVCALQCIKGNDNYFVNSKGGWKTSYIPALYRTFPFKLITSQENKKVVCFRNNSNHLSEDQKDGVELFDQSGEPTQYLKKVMEFLYALEVNYDRTKEAVNTLVSMELLVPLTLRINTDGNENDLSGLWQVDKVKFNSLEGVDWKTLAEKQSLDIVYAHFFSLHKFKDLLDLSAVENKDDTQESLSLTEKAHKKQKDEKDKELNSLVQNLLLDD